MNKKLLFVNKNGSIDRNLSIVAPNEKMFDEKWLQELLIQNPSLLQTKEIDELWDDLIPLGREVSVTAGPIDNLYITSEGLICLVETKLWRNPEAHRTVVAQILDYAKDLSNVSFDEFKVIVEKSSLEGGKPNFWYRVSKHIKDKERIEFQSKVQESLDQGKFLLLVVGDRIYPGVAMLFETIQSAPNLDFRFGLIEIQMFKTSKENPWPLLILPKIVGKTHEITRAVVKIIYEEKKPEVEVEAFDEKATKSKLTLKIFEKSMSNEYAEIFIPVINKWIADGFTIFWGTTGFSIKVFWKGKSYSIIEIYPDKISLLTEKLVNKKGFQIEPYHRYRTEADKIPIVRQLFTRGERILYNRDISLDEFRLLIKITDKMVREYKKLEIID